MKDKATLFSVRKAWWYIPRPYLGFNDPWNGLKGSQGDSYYVAPNPPFGAVFTYYLSESLLTKKEMRTKVQENVYSISNRNHEGFPCKARKIMRFQRFPDFHGIRRSARKMQEAH